MKNLLRILVLCVFVLAGVQSAMALDIPTETEILVDGILTVVGEVSSEVVNGVTYTTYRLIHDVSEGVIIEQDNLTFDGDGFIITGSGSGGILLSVRTGVTIQDVTVSGFVYGIYLDGGGNNNVIGNVLSGNSSGSNGGGIGLFFGSHDNVIKENTIRNNYNGVAFLSGSSNEVYNNNFIGNTRKQVYLKSVGSNTFNSPTSGDGNYWSNWTVPPKSDTDGDGIVDVPYVIYRPDSPYGEVGRDEHPWATQNGWLAPPPINQAPNANAGTDQSVYVGETVTLDGGGSTDDDGDSLTYSWSFISVPADSEATLTSVDSYPAKRTFVVDVSGDYIAQLLVNDGTVNSEAATVTIFALNSAPHADAGLDQTVNLGPPEYGEVTLDGSGSSDPDGDALTYSWTWDDGSIDGGSATGETPTVTLPVGTIVVTLAVSDGVNTSTDTVDITVEETAVPDPDPVPVPEILIDLLQDTLWPPNRRLVHVANISASDLGDAVLHVHVISDESIAECDWVWDDVDGKLYLRAERDGDGDGRVYTITATAEDGVDTLATEEAIVTVPDDQCDDEEDDDQDDKKDRGRKKGRRRVRDDQDRGRNNRGGRRGGRR
jgi:parallel beta-helix repeat protein